MTDPIYQVDNNIWPGPSVAKSSQMQQDVQYGGGDGGGSNMTERIDRLEKKVDSLESALLRLNDSVIRFESKLELQSIQLSGAMDLQSQKLGAALELQSQKLTSSLELQSQKLADAIDKQALVFDGKLKDQKLSIIIWILGLPSFVFALYKIYETFKPN